MLAVDRAQFVQTYTGVPGEIAYQVKPAVFEPAVSFTRAQQRCRAGVH
jgi:hypothetical protein